MPNKDGVLIDVAPGVYPDVPFSDYIRWRALSSSVLRTAREYTLRQAREEFLGNDKPSSRSLFIGSAIHAACLEREGWKSGAIYADEPEGHPNSKDYKEKKKEILESGREILKEDDRLFCDAARNELLSNGHAEPIIKKAHQRELSLVWVHEPTGVLMKSRLDLCHPRFIADLKTSTAVDERNFSYTAEKYGYFEQAALYRAAARNTGVSNVEVFFILAVQLNHQTKTVSDSCVFRINEATMDDAEARLHSEIERWAKCEKEGRWPGLRDEGIVELLRPY